MKRSGLLLWILAFCCSAFAQQPVLRINFETDTSILVSPGVVGSALDLGNVAVRKAIRIANPVKALDQFTILIWVNGAVEGHRAYDILSGISAVDRQQNKPWKFRTIHGKVQSPVLFNGWKIGMQPNGAWQFMASSGDFRYTYAPMPSRQSIRDGAWHLLGISYHRTRAEIRFYYDGQQVAIYNVPRLDKLVPADSLVIGNSVISEYDLGNNEWDTFYGQLDDITFYDRILRSGEIMDYFLSCKGEDNPADQIAENDSIRVTAFNILHGGKEQGKEVGVRRVIDLLKEQDPDICLIVETYGSGEEIADALGYHLYLISSNLSIISRYAVTRTYKLFDPFHAGGGSIEFPGGRQINAFAVWLYHLPSYRKLFSVSGKDVDKFLKEENKTRGAEMKTLLGEIEEVLAGADSIPVVIGGDFNSGSHLDWTEAAAALHNNYVIPWPVSKTALAAGLTDSYRRVHPDAVAFPGFTRPPGGDDKYLTDRIDYIYYKGNKIRPIRSEVIKDHAISFPSDHAAVSTLFAWMNDLK